MRSDTSAGPERVRRQPPGGIDRRPLSVLLLACRIASNPVPARKRWLSAAPREMDSLLAGKTETGASLRLQRRVPLPTALSLGSCLDSAVMRQQLLGSSEFHLSVEYRGAGTVPACADHNAPQAAFHLATQGVSHAEWPQDNETAPT